MRSSIGHRLLGVAFAVVVGVALLRVVDSPKVPGRASGDSDLVEARATVLDTYVKSRGRYPVFRADVSFELPDGRTQETTMRVINPWADEVTVYYDPANPAVVHSALEMRFGMAYAYIPILAVVAALGFGVWAVRRARRTGSSA